MSTHGVCGDCGSRTRLRVNGTLYKHGECEGGQPPLVAAKEESSPEEILIKCGYTNEELHQMLSDLTPKRKKFRQKLSEWWKKFADKFEDAQDVFDG